MKIRSASIILAAGSMAAGLGVGFHLGRGGGTISAQAASAPDGPAKPDVRKISRVEANDVQVYDELAREYDRFKHVDRMFELVSRAVRPTVVHIITQKTTRHEEGQRTRKFEETGSGVIVRSDKASGLYVLTNHHVVEGGKTSRIRVFLQDGRSLTPEKIWSDVMADIAVLKLDRDDLPAARLGDSDVVQVGSWVLALGSPFGLTHSVSQGIISARSRHMDELQDVENQDFLQTDAAINPGNSGGPLVNMLGEVVGINNSIASSHGGNEGVGFSIPINLARWIMNELIVNGRVTRGGLGVILDPDFRPEKAVERGLDRPRGALIERVGTDSPAARGGVRDGDVVLQFGGAVIQDLNHLINAVSMFPVGKPADLVVWRDGRETKLQVMVADRERTLGPPEESTQGGQGDRAETPAKTSSRSMGLELQSLNAELVAGRGLPDTLLGALVVRVEPDSPFAAHCQVGDVIAAVNDQAIQTAEQAARYLALKDGGPLIISIDRPVGDHVERHVLRVP
ncbi:trypsin-like peptidase domain-containing protein [Planctomyces sp. SH-PL62]|uniref:trypsin-like peptidase domain-containing protein n=1 Tax=Planctomyces sp. SH-PL62 TaxID=1636152 RepID=UPI00078B4011|nr:trypsin-like peptidase domain-containing protein [Planctomyces sp. SH-PL62]AMV39502.1 putative periplasmic serine endoprotease DegP-like precursor [Planctomyces sp. SH-PL62]